jgi:hypothetical protein
MSEMFLRVWGLGFTFTPVSKRVPPNQRIQDDLGAQLPAK